MNALDRKFKDLLQQYITESCDSDYDDLVSPSITDPHAIGLIRGRILTMKEIFDQCNFIMKQLTEPEKPLEKK